MAHVLADASMERKVSARKAESDSVHWDFRLGRSGSSGISVFRFCIGCVLGIAAVLFAAALVHLSGWPLPVAAMLCLLIVILTALLAGFWQAAAVSLASVVAQGWLAAHEPAHSNGPASESSATIAVFVLVAIVVSRLAASVPKLTRKADSSGRQMENIYEFTRRTLQMDLHVEPGQQLAKCVHEIFGLEAVAVFDADLHEVYQAGFWQVDPQEMAQNVYYFETSDDDPEMGIGRRVVRLGAAPIGSLVVRGATSPLTNDAIASLIAITFDRYRAFANENRIETDRRTEQLRSTVLDSLAHAYKTPLTAIRAASTGLGEMGHLSPVQAELVALIDEQTSLLNDLTTRLLTTARLDAGEVTVHVAPERAGTLIEDVLGSLKDRLASMKVAVEIEDRELELSCDRKLMVMLLTQYIDNACKYANFGSTITVRALAAGADAIFSVHSYGPVIPVADRERIFDRYYRSSDYSNRAPGTGIGLSVAKRAAQVHGGYVWVNSGEEEGTTFFASIPLMREKAKS